MYQKESGTIFIGFTGEMNCEQCKNKVQMHLRQEYSREKMYFVDQGTNFYHVLRVCPICESQKSVARPKTLLFKADVIELHSLLMLGLTSTKAWFQSMPEVESDKILERYYSLEAFDFMRALLK